LFESLCCIVCYCNLVARLRKALQHVRVGVRSRLKGSDAELEYRFAACIGRLAAPAFAVTLYCAAGDLLGAERLRGTAAAPIDPSIAYGSASSLWPAVGAIIDVQGDSFSECTGVLISPSWVLTAGHCLASDSTPGNYQFIIASDYLPYLPSGGTAASSLFIDPDYNGSETHDVGLIELSAPVDAVTLFVVDDEAAPPVGTTFNVLGYGITQSNINNTHKMLGTSIVGSYAGFGPDQIYFTPNPAIACEGDSGGPFFKVASNGLPVVYATVAFGDGACNASSFTGAIRTAAALTFIKAHATDACFLSGSPLPNCEFVFRNGFDARLANP